MYYESLFDYESLVEECINTIETHTLEEQEEDLL